jgi:beta-glucosidase-like glycosyl hydrolase
MTELRTLERWIGTVLAPEVRVAGTIASKAEIAPSREYLERFPPAFITAFGRTPAGAGPLAQLIARVRATCAELGTPPPAAAVDLEQGAGLHFAGATRFPPALALASAACADEPDELDWILAAGDATAREARALGAELVLAPVADVNTERDNPIIATRSFGDDPRAAAERALAFQIGLRSGGAGACAKHFPGHGDTSRDSHAELPQVRASLATLRTRELAPFRRLIEHGVETVMIAHLDVPALTGEPGCPTSLSRAAIEGTLRGELGFRGVVVSDAMNMGALASFAPRYVRALAAGCDLLLCPHDPQAAAEELLAAVQAGTLSRERLAEAAGRAAALRERLRSVAALPAAPRQARELAERLAERALRWSPGEWRPDPGARCQLAPSVPAAEIPEVADGLARLAEAVGAAPGGYELIPVLCEARAGRGRYSLRAEELAELETRLAAARGAGRRVGLLWFGSPQSLPERLWSSVPVVLALAPTPPLFDAVGRWAGRLAGSGGGVPREVRRLPAALG